MQFGRARTFIALLALLTVAIGIIVPAHARAEPVAPPDDALKLHSVPGADRVIYLDFDGETLVGTKWNEMWRRDSIELSAGDANASNIAMQMVDPWPRYAGNKNIAYNGQRMQAAVQRYRNNQVIPPQGISASTTYGAPSNPNAAAPANNTTPVGPTVAGSVK